MAANNGRRKNAGYRDMGYTPDLMSKMDELVFFTSDDGEPTESEVYESGCEWAGHVSDAAVSCSSIAYESEGHILDKLWPGRKDFRVPADIMEALKMIVERFPTGVSAKKLFYLFNEEKGFYLDYRMYGFQSFVAMIKKQSEVFHVLDSPFADCAAEPIVFSAHVQDRLDEQSKMVMMLDRIWTAVEVVLKKSGYVALVDSIPRSLSEILGYPVDPEAWSFHSPRKFYEYSVEKNQNACLVRGKEYPFTFLTESMENPEQHVLVQLNPSSDLPTTYLKRCIERQKDWMQRLTQSRMRKVHDDILERIGFFTPWHYIPPMSDEVEQDRLYLCIPVTVYNPENFYVNPCSTWNKLEGLMAHMLKEYTEVEESFGDRSAVPWKPHLEKGMYVVARCRAENEYHRAIVVKPLPEDLYKVFLVDYGDHQVVHFSQIRYLKLEFAYPLLRQSIRCKIKLPLKIEKWTKAECGMFKELIFNQTLVVHFKNRVKVNGEDVWEVYIHLFDSKSREITEFHIEREFLRSTRQIDLVRACYGLETDDSEVEIEEFNTATKVCVSCQ